MGLLKLLTPLDASKYPAVLTPGSYSALVRDTVGTAGDPGDAVDLSLGDLAAALANFAADLPNLDADVADFASAAAAVNSSGADAIVASLPGADQAVTASKNAYLTNTGQVVNANPPPPATPPAPTRGQTDPNSYGPFPAMPANANGYYGETKLPTMVVGDPQRLWQLTVGQPNYGGLPANSVQVIQADPDVWAFSAEWLGDRYQQQYIADLYARAVKVGRFPFIVQYNFPTLGLHYVVYGGVTIIAA